MNNDRISNTPGGERILFGAVAFGFSLAIYAGLRYELGTFGAILVFSFMAIGAVQLVRGLFEWKYADRRAFANSRRKQSLLIDVPINGDDKRALHAIEDALIDLIRVSKTVDIEMHSIDTANSVGTIHLVGANADAMFAHVYSTLARFAKPSGLNLFPPQGQDIDTETHGKRVFIVLQDREPG